MAYDVPLFVAVKQRMKSVTNIQKITKAMKMVAASRLRVAQAATFESRGIVSPLVRLLDDLPGLPSPSNRPHLIILLAHSCWLQRYSCLDVLLSLCSQKVLYIKGLELDAAADVEKNLTVAVTSDKGLCGGINSSVSKMSKGALKTFLGGSLLLSLGFLGPSDCPQPGLSGMPLDGPSGMP